MSKKRLSPCFLKLQDYQGNPIPILGSWKVRIQHKGFLGRFKIIVVIFEIFLELLVSDMIQLCDPSGHLITWQKENSEMT